MGNNSQLGESVEQDSEGRKEILENDKKMKLYHMPWLLNSQKDPQALR